MALPAGTRLGPYEIAERIGEGGMGIVYLARDTKLKRQVAIKVLPEAVAADPDRLARFQREAEVLAALNHPSIAAIYGLEEAGASKALVMELVEGPTLADLIHGPARSALGSGRSVRGLPTEQALAIALQVAEALDAAHEQSIIHRDLKPANVKVRPDGTVKVLDFGLAKIIEPPGATSASAAQATTVTSPAMTGLGVILGTAAYMSPEQARGKPVDRRTDVWAFGCVLYEMLTGRRAFEGDEVSDTLAVILTKEPDWTALPPDCPTSLHRLLRRCVRKDRAERLPDIGTVRIEIKEMLDAPPDVVGLPASAPALAQRPWRQAAAALAVAVIFTAIGATVVWIAVRGDRRTDVTRWTISAPGRLSPGNMALTDRAVVVTAATRRVVYVGSWGTQLFVRPFDQLDPIPLGPQGLNIRGLFVSPDDAWLGFVDVAPAHTVIRKIALTGGPVVDVHTFTGASRGATWSEDGSIVFATDEETGLLRVSDAGGEPSELTKPNRERGEADHLWPQILPGGRHVLYTISPAMGEPANAQAAVLDLQTGVSKVLVRGATLARYLPTGHVLYFAAGSLLAVAFDLSRLETSGSPVAILPDVADAVRAINIDVSSDGTLVYLTWPSRQASPRSLVWVGRDGRESPTGAPDRAYVTARLSPDDRRAAVTITGDGGSNIWIWNFASETLSRATFDPGDASPVWLPDGRLVYSSSRDGGALNIYRRTPDGLGEPERLTWSPNPQTPNSVTPDGASLVFTEQSGLGDMRRLALDGPPEPLRRMEDSSPLIATPRSEGNGEISPDGRWVAYQAADDGRYEIFVRPFPDVQAGLWAISSSGARQPVWTRESGELFYLDDQNGDMMGVRVDPRSEWSATRPAKIFDARAYLGPEWGRSYDVSADGTRFLMIKAGPIDQTASSPSIVVVENWFEELKRLVPLR